MTRTNSTHHRSRLDRWSCRPRHAAFLVLVALAVSCTGRDEPVSNEETTSAQRSSEAADVSTRTARRPAGVHSGAGVDIADLVHAVT